jgi:hypothetical protein
LRSPVKVVGSDAFQPFSVSAPVTGVVVGECIAIMVLEYVLE